MKFKTKLQFQNVFQTPNVFSIFFFNIHSIFTNFVKIELINMIQQKLEIDLQLQEARTRQLREELANHLATATVDEDAKKDSGKKDSKKGESFTFPRSDDKTFANITVKS